VVQASGDNTITRPGCRDRFPNRRSRVGCSFLTSHALSRAALIPVMYSEVWRYPTVHIWRGKVPWRQYLPVWIPGHVGRLGVAGCGEPDMWHERNLRPSPSKERRHMVTFPSM